MDPNVDQVNDELPIHPPVDVGANLSQSERDLRDRFVVEYLVDYDEYKAAIRLGYSPPFAKEFCKRFMGEGYVLQKIQQAEVAVPDIEDEEAQKRRIVTALWKEANLKGFGSSQSARVAALAKLSAFYGMDAPSRSQSEITGPDGKPLGEGVFVVPGMMTSEDWEKQAATQQEELVRPTKPPQLKIAS